MGKASIFDEQEEEAITPGASDTLDLNGFAPDYTPRIIDRSAAEQVSAGHGYVDRQPAKALALPDTRYRTGRNIQMNLKVSAETQRKFERLSEGQSRAVTFEDAVNALWQSRFGQ